MTVSILNLPLPGQRVRVIKRSACASAIVGPSSWNDWIPGSWDNQGGIPIDYEIEGILLEPIEVHGNLFVARHLRNGVRADGFFVSTMIVELDSPDRIVTRNSIYSISRP